MKLNRKWILVMSLVLSLVIATGSTLAYLMDTTETKTNVFTLGDVEIELTEPDWVDNSVLLPNQPVTKDPTITNKGWHDAWVWMEVVIPSTLYEHLTLNGISDDWIRTNATDDKGNTVVTLKYKETLASGESVKAFDSVTLSADAKYDDLKDLGSKVEINVTAYAIEAGSFASVDLAYAAFNNESNPDPNAWNGTIPENLNKTTLDIVPDLGNKTGTITVKSANDLLYLTKLSEEWVGLYSNGQGTEVGNYYQNAGGQGTDYYYHWEWTVELGADINLNNIPMDSIDVSYWGAFDGKGHTISNVVLNDGKDGLFTSMRSHSIRDLTVENISINAPGDQGVGALSDRTGALTNVHVINASIKGGKYTGGLAGTSSSVQNSSIKNASVTANGKTAGSLVGYAVGDPNPINVKGNTVEDVKVTGPYNVGGLVGQAQNGTFTGNTVKNVTVTSTTGLPADASSSEKRIDEIAARQIDATVNNNTTDNVVCVLNVSSAAELSALSAVAMTDNNNKPETAVINIMNDIDMNNADFSAIIAQRGDKLIVNGNGKKISNVNVVSGANDNTTGQASMFYAYPNSTLEVSNLKLANINVNADANGTGYAAAVIGYCEGNAVLNNVDVEATVVGVKSSGMLCGHLSGSLTATDCDVKGTVMLNDFSEEPNGHYAGKYIGTLAGPATLTNCTVDVTVGGNLNSANDGTVYGRKTAAGSLTQN